MAAAYLFVPNTDQPWRNYGATMEESGGKKLPLYIGGK